MTNIWIIKSIMAAGRAHTFSFKIRKQWKQTHTLLLLHFISPQHIMRLNVRYIVSRPRQQQEDTRHSYCPLRPYKLNVEVCISIILNYKETSPEMPQPSPARPSIVGGGLVWYTVEIHYSLMFGQLRLYDLIFNVTINILSWLSADIFSVLRRSLNNKTFSINNLRNS